MAAGALMIPTLAMTASGAEYNDSTTASKQEINFTKANYKTWYATVNVGGEKVSVQAKIGYDTTFRNEDYITEVWAPTGWSHYGKVENSKGESAKTKSTTGGFNSNKADVVHTGSPVQFWVYVEV